MSSPTELAEIPANPLNNIATDVVHRRKLRLLSNGLADEKRCFDQAQVLLRSPFQWRDHSLRNDTEACQALTDRERKSFEDDQGSIWDRLKAQPWSMMQLILLCGLGAMVQGWDEAAVNGAQVYYTQSFGLSSQTSSQSSLIGLINGAPYLCCFFSCWLTLWLNDWLGRRGTIFLAALISAAFALGQAFSNDWWTMFILRLGLGLGIGPKSATIPIYAAECAPAGIRGALVMIWQLFTALGIMLGYLSGVAFANVQQGSNALNRVSPCSDDVLSLQCTLNWRLMIGSPMVAPVFLCLYIYVQPESPRWLMKKAHTALRKNQKDRAEKLILQVFTSLVRLRNGSKVKAARDMLIIDVLLSEQHKEKDTSPGPLRALLSETRNRSALRASLIVMFLQQYCGINVLIYYSTWVLSPTGAISESSGLPNLFQDSGIPQFMVASFGIGAINFFFGLPAILVIDKWGRRKLLLQTFLLLALFQAFVAIATISELQPSINRTAFILVGMYLFAAAYSPGEGPVPFVYASESFPQETRDLGMGIVTSINWISNFTVAVSFPPMTNSMKFTGAFWFYSVMCLTGFWLIYFFVPETKGKELEQLDEVFSKSMMELARENWQELKATISRLPWPWNDPENPPSNESDSDSGPAREEDGSDGFKLHHMPIRRQTTNRDQ